MTQNEFVQACMERTIIPELALEDEDIVEALRNRDDDRVEQLLDTHF